MAKRNYMKLKSVKIRKDDNVLDAIEAVIPHWIHHKREDAASVSGFYWLPECECSECGFVVNMEKPVCPHCGANMRMLKGKSEDAQETE